MVEKTNQSQLARLWQTLIYFEIIPGIGCLQRIFARLTNRAINANNEQPTMETVLLVGFHDNLGKTIAESLNKQDYILQALVPNVSEAQQVFDPNIKLIEGNSLTTEIMNNVETVIYNPNNISELNSFLQSLPINIKQTTEKMLFDFTNPTIEIKEVWGALDDVVMGGVSQSNIRLYNDVAVFSGNVSTANNGGFASVRTKNFNPTLDLSEYQGIQLRVKGDGKRYKFITRCEGKWDGIGYCYSFDTVYDFPLNIRIPFNDLIPVFRAKTVNDAGEFDASKVYSLQLMLSKFEYDGQLNLKFDPGFFALEIENIKAYGNKQQSTNILIVDNQKIEDLRQIVTEYSSNRYVNINIINSQIS